MRYESGMILATYKNGALFALVLHQGFVRSRES